MGSGNGDSGGALWSLLWLVILILIGFWLAGLCAFLYIILNMFAACVEALDVSKFIYNLHKIGEHHIKLFK